MAQGALTYRDLVIRYGKHTAFDLLLTIEKAAKITHNITYTDEETRLLRAFEAIDSNNEVI